MHPRRDPPLPPRLPVYIVAVYFSVLYVATVAASKLQLPPIAGYP